jgi:hypothetical protein
MDCFGFACFREIRGKELREMRFRSEIQWCLPYVSCLLIILIYCFVAFISEKSLRKINNLVGLKKLFVKNFCTFGQL